MQNNSQSNQALPANDTPALDQQTPPNQDSEYLYKEKLDKLYEKEITMIGYNAKSY